MWRSVREYLAILPSFWYFTILFALNILNWFETVVWFKFNASQMSQTHKSSIASNESIFNLVGLPNILKNSDKC